ncbi:MAG: MFS transporter [Gammaproteobacteria bacterium]|nr:MFS transporter [Gammaproteobacteria bacterium]
MKSFFESLNPDGNLSLCLISFVGTVGLTALVILPILVGSYIDYLGFAENAAGWISAINLSGIAVMTLIVSLKTKHWSLAKITGYGLVVMIISDFLSLYFHSLEIFSALRFMSGMGGGAAQAAVAAAIARLAHSDKGFGIYMAFQFLMPALGLFVFPSLLPDIGFNGMLEILIGFEIFSLLMVPVLMNYRCPVHTEQSQEGNFEVALILQKPAILSIIGLCIYGAANAAIWAYADRMGLDSGLSYEGTGTVLSISTAVAVLGAMLVIWLKDRWGHTRPLVLGITCQIIAMFVMIFEANPIGYTIGISLYSVAWAFTWPYFLSIQAALDDSGTVVVAGQFSNLVGNSMGPAMAAFFVGSGGHYIPAIWMACALFVASLLPMLKIYKIRRG